MLGVGALELAILLILSPQSSENNHIPSESMNPEDRNPIGPLKRIVDDLYTPYLSALLLAKDTVCGLVCPKEIHWGPSSLTLILW